MHANERRLTGDRLASFYNLRIIVLGKEWCFCFERRSFVINIKGLDKNLLFIKFNNNKKILSEIQLKSIFLYSK